MAQTPAKTTQPLAGKPVPAFGLDRTRALECLAAAVYYEAAREPRAGQEAVAQVVLNRLRHPAYPKSVCGVVFQGSERRTGCQFTFTCDGALARRPSAAAWARAQAVAQRALDGQINAPVGAATNYHADYVAPGWRTSLVEVAQIGAHIFYRKPRAAEGLFGAYTGGERGLLRHAKGRVVAPARKPGVFGVWGIEIAAVRRSGGSITVRPLDS